MWANYPNPFNARTAISYQVPEPGWVELTLYNMLGQPVKHLVRETQRAGTHRLFWDGTDDLQEGGIYHWGNMVNDVDETDGSFENREAQWSTAANGGNARALTDVLLAPLDPGITWPEGSTAVEAQSWGRIKAQF